MLTVLKPSETDLVQLQEVDEIIVRSVASGDPLIAAEYGLSLTRAAAMKGLALAKLLYGIRTNWELFQAAGVEDEFENFAEAHIGVSPQTARKYSDMWRSIFESEFVADEIKEQLRSKPIKELLLITAAVEEGSFTDEELRTVVVADESKIRDMVAVARGKQSTSSNAIKILLQVRDGKHPRGTLISSYQGSTEVIGFLKMDLEGPAQKAIARIINSAHLIERE